MKSRNTKIQIFDSSKFKVDKKVLSKIIKDILENINKRFEKIGINFVDDENLLKMNVKFLNHNYLTDIITFTYSEAEPYSCEMFISYERACDNSRKYKNNFSEEILRLIIHGILHTLGYKDNSSVQKKIMRIEENKILNSILKRDFVKTKLLEC